MHIKHKQQGPKRKFLTAMLCILACAYCFSIGKYAYYSYKHKKERENSPDPMIVRIIAGVSNPFRLKEKIGSYYTYNMEEGYENRSDDPPRCGAEFYTLLDSAPSQNMKMYLRQFDTEGEDWSTWLSRNELRPSLFNPFDENLKRQEEQGNPDISDQVHYLTFLECENFLREGNTPMEQRTPNSYVGVEHTFANDEIARRNFDIIKKVIESPNTLVRIRTRCNNMEAQFYSTEYRLFINLEALRWGWYSNKDYHFSSYCKH